jgi:hypothetical protein
MSRALQLAVPAHVTKVPREPRMTAARQRLNQLPDPRCVEVDRQHSCAGGRERTRDRRADTARSPRDDDATSLEPRPHAP